MKDDLFSRLGQAFMPEPPIEPDEDFSVMADCQHEVYEGESLIEWNGKTLCPDCFWDKVKEMSVEEVASMFNCDYKTVTAHV